MSTKNSLEDVNNLRLFKWYNLITQSPIIILFVISLVIFITLSLNIKSLILNNQTILEDRKEIERLKDSHLLLTTYETLKLNKAERLSSFQRKCFDQPTSLEVLKKMIQRWQQDQKIEMLNTIFGSPQIESKDLNLYKVPVTIEIKILKDHQFYSLLHFMQYSLPGMSLIIADCIFNYP